MDLQYYQYFVEIARCRSISKAAEKLFVSQPYLSKVLSRLEQELGTKLMDRSSIPIRLTDEGECLLHYAGQILELDQHMRERISYMRKEGTAFIIGTPPFLEAHVMPEILMALHRMYPHTKFQMTSAPLVELMRQLQSGAIHAVFAMQHPVMGGAPCIPVDQDRVVIALPRGHRFYRAETAGTICPPWFPLSALSGDSFVLPPPGSITRQNYDQILASLQIQPHIVTETDNPDAMFRFLNSGDGIILTPETGASDMDHCQAHNYIALQHALTYHTLVVSYYEPSPFIQSLVQVLQEYYGKKHLPRGPETSPEGGAGADF